MANGYVIIFKHKGQKDEIASHVFDDKEFAQAECDRMNDAWQDHDSGSYVVGSA
jgi:hypothetical protein